MMKKTLVAAIIFFSTCCYSQVSFIEPIIKNNNGRAVTAGFVIIKSDENLLINKISSDVSKRIEIHSMKMENDVMKMRKIEEPKIEKNKEFILSKGGDHLMIYDLTKNLETLKAVDVEFSFTNEAGESFNRLITFEVK